MSDVALQTHHQELVDKSAIAPEVAAARGYRSVTTKADRPPWLSANSSAACRDCCIQDGTQLGSPQAISTGLMSRASRTGSRSSTRRPTGRACGSMSHRASAPRLGNPKIPLWITEGIRKADAAVSQGMCCIALIGVWNWRGRNDDGGLTALADWELIHLKARDVYLVFDSDVMTKPSVHAALRRLKAFLEARGAHVHIVYLDPDPSGAKVGLDDFFAAGGTVA